MEEYEKYRVKLEKRVFREYLQVRQQLQDQHRVLAATERRFSQLTKEVLALKK